MEQNDGLKPLPLAGAATDPAYIPGLTAPPPEAAEETSESDEDVAEETDDASSEDQEPETDDADDDAAQADADDEEEAVDEGDDDGDDDEPEFEAADRRGSVTAGRSGVRFQLDDTEAEFDWDEVGAIEYGTSRFGRRLTVTVHTRKPERSYPAEVEAPDKARLKEWTTALDTILDSYFEE